MLSLLTALALAGPAHADCGARLLRVSDDQPWLVEDVRAVVRTDGAPEGIDRWLVDLGEAGCGPGGTCAPVFDASWQPDRTTAFFAGRLVERPADRGAPMEIRLTLDDGRIIDTKADSRTGGHANLHTVAVDGADLVLTRPVLQPRLGGRRVAVRAVGVDAGRIRTLSITPEAGEPAPLDRKQLHRVAEGEARADLGRSHRAGAATLIGLDADGAERCHQELSAELDLGWQKAR
jgi:hypothetical protein